MRNPAAGILLGASLMAALGGCAVRPADRWLTAPPAEPVEARAPRSAASYWAGGGGEGEELVTIKLDRQTAEIRKDGNLIGVSPVTSGREGYETPPGRFEITQKSPDHRSNLYGSTLTPRRLTPPKSKFLSAPLPVSTEERHRLKRPPIRAVS